MKSESFRKEQKKEKELRLINLNFEISRKYFFCLKKWIRIDYKLNGKLEKSKREENKKWNVYA